MDWKAYLQLIRLPNVFTAAADSLAGWLLVRGSLEETGHWVPLVLASACTYAGGIALNDVCDIEIDRVERPGRPLPSGRISLPIARTLAILLLFSGSVFANLSGVLYALGTRQRRAHTAGRGTGQPRERRPAAGSGLRRLE